MPGSRATMSPQFGFDPAKGRRRPETGVELHGLAEKGHGPAVGRHLGLGVAIEGQEKRFHPAAARGHVGPRLDRYRSEGIGLLQHGLDVGVVQGLLVGFDAAVVIGQACAVNQHHRGPTGPVHLDGRDEARIHRDQRRQVAPGLGGKLLRAGQGRQGVPEEKGGKQRSQTTKHGYLLAAGQLRT